MKQSSKFMAGRDRSRLSQALFDQHGALGAADRSMRLKRLHDREASLITVVDAGRAQLARVRDEIKTLGGTPR